MAVVQASAPSASAPSAAAASAAASGSPAHGRGGSAGGAAGVLSTPPQQPRARLEPGPPARRPALVRRRGVRARGAGHRFRVRPRRGLLSRRTKRDPQRRPTRRADTRRSYDMHRRPLPRLRASDLSRGAPGCLHPRGQLPTRRGGGRRFPRGLWRRACAPRPNAHAHAHHAHQITRPPRRAYSKGNEGATPRGEEVARTLAPLARQVKTQNPSPPPPSRAGGLKTAREGDRRPTHTNTQRA